MGVKDLGTASGGSLSVPAFGSAQDGGIVARPHRYLPAPGGVGVCQLCGKAKGTSHLKPKPLARGAERALSRLGHKHLAAAGLETKAVGTVYHWKQAGAGVPGG